MTKDKQSEQLELSRLRAELIQLGHNRTKLVSTAAKCRREPSAMFTLR